MNISIILASLILATGGTRSFANEADGPRNIPLTPAELGVHHLLIPGTINIMAEVGGGQALSLGLAGQSSMARHDNANIMPSVGERSTVQVHVFVKATVSKRHTSLRGLFFVGESSSAAPLN